jgi:polyisoprenoid-binding protein YceI
MMAMQKIRTASLLAILLTAAVPLPAAEYKYTQEKSQLHFTVRHINIVTVRGQFKKFTGVFRFDPQKVDLSYVELRIESSSLETGNPSKNKEFRSENFFWVDKFPEITFTSKEFKDVKGNRFNIYGDLTIRGITKPVVFQTEMLTPINQAASAKPIHFHTFTFIRRKDFGLGTGKGFDPVVFMTHETLKISLLVEGVPAPGLNLPPAPAAPNP